MGKSPKKDLRDLPTCAFKDDPTVQEICWIKVAYAYGILIYEEKEVVSIKKVPVRRRSRLVRLEDELYVRIIQLDDLIISVLPVLPVKYRSRKIVDGYEEYNFLTPDESVAVRRLQKPSGRLSRWFTSRRSLFDDE